MYCNKCGNEIAPNTKFCDKCGTPVLQSNAQPNQGYTQPNQGYTQPNQGYTQPNQGYTQPNQGYTQPNQGYTQPNQGYTQPNQGYTQPNQGYTQPNQGYTQPNQGYTQPNQGYTQPNQGYTYQNQSYMNSIPQNSSLNGLIDQTDLKGTILNLASMISSALIILLLIFQHWVKLDINTLFVNIDESCSLFGLLKVIKNISDTVSEAPVIVYVLVAIPIIICLAAAASYVIGIVRNIMKKPAMLFTIIASGLYIIAFVYVLFGVILVNYAIKEELGRYFGNVFALSAVPVITLFIVLANVTVSILYSLHIKKKTTSVQYM